MISKRSNTASAKGRDIAPGVPAQKGSVMENASDNGRLADATGLSSAAPIEPVPVSPVPASIPSADKVMLTHAGPRNGGFEFGFRDGEEGGVLHIIAAHLADMMQLDSDKPLNCVQMDVQPAGKPCLTLTMQRSGGKSPLSLKAEAVGILKGVLVAIDTGRNEPLQIVRDQIQNYLADDITAQAIETRSAKTEGLGPQDESVVAEPCAQGDAA